jgi:peptidoglycan/LPS O-acetylase OafA/YrhL
VRRFALFDSLRGLAVLCVLGLHIGQECGANQQAWYGALTSQLRVGVTLFFLLSGFLLYRPHALAALRGTSAPDPAGYAWRRFLRIAPTYWVALTLLAIWPGLRGVFTADWWVYYGFAQSYWNGWAFGGIAPAWSLSAEVSFYAMLPVLAAALRRAGAPLRPGGRAVLQLTALAVLGLASLGLRSAAWKLGNPHLQTTVFATFLWFALGMGLAVVSVWLEGRERQPAWVDLVARRPGACWLAALALFASTATWLPRAFAPGYTLVSYTAEHVVFALIALLVMLPAVFAEQAGGLPRRILAHPAPSGVGRLSYSLFLWHYPLVLALAERGAAGLVPGWPFLSLAALSTPIVLGVAWLSYRQVELPTQDWRRLR